MPPTAQHSSLSTDAFKLQWFVINVIPPIIFFVAFVQLLYFWGVLQWAIGKSAFFFWSMRVSGAEAVVATASPFVGQGESAMLIKPFISHLTDAELHQVMTSGFATIAGSVLAAYIGMGISATALISSCVMSIPASLAISKLRYPETEKPLTAGKIVIPASDEKKPQNSLHAFGNGSWLGIKIGGMIVAALLCILALLGLTNGPPDMVGPLSEYRKPRSHRPAHPRVSLLPHRLPPRCAALRRRHPKSVAADRHQSRR
jgi:concentrative nucleoside transporter, CNT family